MQSQTLRLGFDGQSWHYSDGALRALLEIISNISQSATVRALPRRILKASVSGPRRLEMSAKNRDPTVSYVTLEPDQNNDPSHSVGAGNCSQRPLTQSLRVAPEAPSNRRAAVVLKLRNHPPSPKDGVTAFPNSATTQQMELKLKTSAAFLYLVCVSKAELCAS